MKKLKCINPAGSSLIENEIYYGADFGDHYYIIDRSYYYRTRFVELEEDEMDKELKQKFQTLKELAMPLYSWMQENYPPNARIIIENGFVSVVQDECGVPLPNKRD